MCISRQSQKPLLLLFYFFFYQRYTSHFLTIWIVSLLRSSRFVNKDGYFSWCGRHFSRLLWKAQVAALAAAFQAASALLGHKAASVSHSIPLFYPKRRNQTPSATA